VIEEAEALEALRSSHTYQLSDLSGIFGFLNSTLSEILSLNKLPKLVKDDCRADEKASRGALVEIAKQRTEAKMLALYEKYRKKGLTRDDIRAAAVPRSAKQTDGPADVSFTANFLKRLDALDTGKVGHDQHDTLVETLEKIRSTAFQKLKALKGQVSPPPQPAP
jgi:ParB family chromosome partitioning protein